LRATIRAVPRQRPDRPPSYQVTRPELLRLAQVPARERHACPPRHRAARTRFSRTQLSPVKPRTPTLQSGCQS